MGSDDGLHVWLNGKQVHDHLVNRGLTVDEDKAAVEFKGGVNWLLVKVSQDAGGWAFCVRVTTPDGAPLTFSQTEQEQK
jgi:hypothetical protein